MSELTPTMLKEAVVALETHKTQYKAALALGIPRTTLMARLQAAKLRKINSDTNIVEIPVTIPKSDVYVITCAQNATPVHKGFWKALQQYCKKRNARLVVIPTRYKNPTSRFSADQENDEWWASEVMEYLCAGRVVLNNNLMVLGDIKVQPTATTPLSSFGPISRHYSGIIGHPKLALTTIATPQDTLPKMMATTGACTIKNYTDSRAGKNGEFHHSFGALVVEIQDKWVFHLRQLNAIENGSFIDLDMEYTSRGYRKAPPAAGLFMGDTHVEHVDPKVVDATFAPGGIVEVLKPKILVWADLLDFFSQNHHHRNRPFTRLAKHKAGRQLVIDELKKTLNFLSKHTPKGVQSLVQASNHNEHLDRWVREADWKYDMDNAEVYLETALAMAKSAKMDRGRVEVVDPMVYWAKRLMPKAELKRVKFLSRDEGFLIKDVEVSFHGDEGANGARGSRKAFKSIGRRTIIGHSHSPGIEDGCYQVGTSSYLRLEYNSGLSSWLQSHAVIYANGKRSLIHIIGSDWRAHGEQNVQLSE